MMGTLARGMILVNFALSILFLGWAVAVYTGSVDFGWKDPRQDVSLRVPSEIDKRLASMQALVKLRAAADRELKGAGDYLARVEPRRYMNRLWYNDELARLESGDGEIEVKHVKLDKDGLPVLDPNELGRPYLEDDVVFLDASKKPVKVNRSYRQYRAEWNKVVEEIKKVKENIGTLVEKQEEITKALNGVKKWDAKGNVVQADPAGKATPNTPRWAQDKDGNLLMVTRPGLHDLIDQEDAVQKDLRAETNYLRPLWIREMVDAQLLVERRTLLRERLAELKALLAARR